MRFKPEGHVIFFATSNIHKFNEARAVLNDYKIAVGMLRVKSLEIQQDDLEEIAKASVNDAFQKYKLPLIVEDAGLFIEKLNGFPGPYAAFVYRTIGNNGLLRLMEASENREACFRSAIAYRSQKMKEPLCFTGEISGEIIREERSSHNRSSFGFDPVFRPLHRDKVFAEMSIIEKNYCSHRAVALRKFAEWYKGFM